jgi:hypothetical protein
MEIKRNRKSNERVLAGIMILFIVFSYLLFDKIFARDLPPFAYNIMASVLGTMITIALMMLLMQYQVKSEQEKEFKAILFEKKIQIYREFLNLVFKMDDDNLIDKNEVQEVENMLSEVSLVGSKELVEVCCKFIVQLKCYGVLYTRSMMPSQIRHYEQTFGELSGFVSLDDLIQEFRYDISVVSGDVSSLVDSAVNRPYDQYRLIKDPNVVD